MASRLIALLRNYHMYNPTATQTYRIVNLKLLGKKRPAIPLQGGGLLLLEPGVVSLPLCLFKCCASKRYVCVCVCFAQNQNVKVCVECVPVFVYRRG